MYLPALHGKATFVSLNGAKQPIQVGVLKEEFKIGFQDFRKCKKVPAIPFDAKNEAVHKRYQMEDIDLQGGKKSNQIF
jgi:hypothetical protein